MKKETVKLWLRGLWRFIKIVGGVASDNSHEVANSYVLLAGFFIEYLIIRAAVINTFPLLGDHLQTLMPFLLTILLIPLFFHQFLIFRNFALPTKIENRRERQKVNQQSSDLLARMKTPNKPTDTEIISMLERIAD